LGTAAQTCYYSSIGGEWIPPAFTEQTTTMKFLATQTRNIRNPRTGAFKTVVKGQIYTESHAKHFFKNGEAPDFLVDGNLSHFERFVLSRPELLNKYGFESCTYLAVCKGIVEYFGGDTKSLRKFALGGGTVKMAQRFERELAEEMGIEKIPTAPHGSDDPFAAAYRTWDFVYACSKADEAVIMDRMVAHLNDLY